MVADIEEKKMNNKSFSPLLPPKKYVTKSKGTLIVNKAGCERLLENTNQAGFSTNSTNFQPV